MRRDLRSVAAWSPAAGCVSCHNDDEKQGAADACGRAMQTPFGTIYAPNITPR